MDRGFIDMANGEQEFPEKPTNCAVYISHLKEVEKDWNRFFKKHGLKGLSFSAKDAIKLARDFPHIVTGDAEVCDFIAGDRDGRIWFTQIETTVMIIKQTLENSGRSGVCIGATVCGKTGTANNSSWIAPAIYLMTGQKCQSLYLVPNKKAIEAQAADEFKKFIALYGSCELIYKNEKGKERKITLKNYFTQILHSSEVMRELYDPTGPQSRDNNGSHIRRRARGSIFNQIKDICEEAHKQNVRVIFLTDELHWGAAENGMQWQIMDAASEGLLEEGYGDIVIGFSATPWQVANLSKFWKVRHKLYPNYVGFNMFNGEPLDPDVDCELPNYMSFEEFEDISEIKNFKNINRAAYNSKDSFEKQKKKQKNGTSKDGRQFPSTHEEYVEQTEKAIVNALNWALVKKNPYKGKGAVIRFPYKNIDAVAFEKMLRKRGLHEDIEVIIYTGLAVKSKIEKVIRRRKGAKENKPFVVIATGSLRMGDNIPGILLVQYYFDFSEESNLVALFQGLLGRSCGNNYGHIPPLVVLSASATKTVNFYVRTMGLPPSLPSRDVSAPTELNLVAGRGAPTSSITLKAHRLAQSDCPLIKEAFKKLSEKLKPYLQPNMPFRGRFVPGFWSEIFTEDVLTAIEEKQLSDEIYVEPARILRPGERDATNETWRMQGDSTFVGFRDSTKPASTNSNKRSDLRSDRFIQGGTSRKRSHSLGRLDVQLHVNRSKTRPGKIYAVRLRLNRPAKSLVRPINGVLPNDRTGYNRFLTDEERKSIGNDNKNNKNNKGNGAA